MGEIKKAMKKGKQMEGRAGKIPGRRGPLSSRRVKTVWRGLLGRGPRRRKGKRGGKVLKKKGSLEIQYTSSHQTCFGQRSVRVLREKMTQWQPHEAKETLIRTET